MKFVIVDLSGKIPYYDHALCTELHKLHGKDAFLFTPYKQEEYNPSYKVKCLCRLYEYKNKKLRRIIKGIEGIINYLYLIIYFIFNRVGVIHLQWLPFLEFCGVDKYFLMLLKHTTKAKVLLTVHNIYPHDMVEHTKKRYVERFSQCAKYIDAFIVHNNSSKLLLTEDFKIPSDIINVIHHGIFVPEVFPKPSMQSDKMNLLMFGIQSKYKGTDLLVEAIGLLQAEEREKISVTIAGKTNQDLYQEYINKAESLQIKWVNRYLTDEELNQLITDSDLVLFPYRDISQSGALLLTLAFRKQLVVSLLPSFIETLDGLPSSSFVEVGSSSALASNISKRIRKEVNIQSELEAIDSLQDKYSWRESAIMTLCLYKKIV